MTKCIVCKQVFMQMTKRPQAGKTTKLIKLKTCPGCRIIGSRAPERHFKEKKK